MWLLQWLEIKWKWKKYWLSYVFTLEFHRCCCWIAQTMKCAKCTQATSDRSRSHLTLAHTTPQSKAYNKQVSFQIWYDRAWVEISLFGMGCALWCFGNAFIPPVSSRLASSRLSSLLFASLFVIAFRYFKYVRLFVWYLRRIYLFTFNPIFFSLSLSLLIQILIRHIIRYNDQWNSE